MAGGLGISSSRSLDGKVRDFPISKLTIQSLLKDGAAENEKPRTRVCYGVICAASGIQQLRQHGR